MFAAGIAGLAFAPLSITREKWSSDFCKKNDAQTKNPSMAFVGLPTGDLLRPVIDQDAWIAQSATKVKPEMKDFVKNTRFALRKAERSDRQSD